ncbi:MAG: methylated-DNA--[protein]-cysteine S-methyltransferase [Nitrospiraceae bacterium]
MPRSLVYETPWGWMGVAAAAGGVYRIVLPRASRQAVEKELPAHDSRLNNEPLARGKWRGSQSTLRQAQQQLAAYLVGRRRELDFPVDLSKGTAFQRQVWRVIRRIPYGRVRSYKWVATRVGGAKYARAVGHALGANPVPIIVPCHRVIAHDASLGGFTAGVRTKRRLLELEGTLRQLGRKV